MRSWVLVVRLGIIRLEQWARKPKEFKIMKKIGVLVLCLCMLFMMLGCNPPGCKHEYEITSQVNPTCLEGGEIHRRCSLCGDEYVEYPDPLNHLKVEKHRVEPTLESEGKIDWECSRCFDEWTETLEKLKPITIEFNGLKIVFGQYSIVTVNNTLTEYYGQEVVKIPITVTNLSSEPHYLNMFYYELFVPNGTESPNMAYYFDDDNFRAGTLLSGKSYDTNLHILYDGAGTYTIVFNDFFQMEVVEIVVSR